MNTFLARANTIFAFTLTVLAALTLGCFLTTAFNDHTSTVVIDSTTASVKNVPDYSAARMMNDLGFISFDLIADLDGLFNWNVKQIFVYLTAEYSTPNNVSFGDELTVNHVNQSVTSRYKKKLNQVVLWDKIIRRGESAVLDLRDMKAKYYFFDDGHGLRSNKNVTLFLAWNVIPNAGTLPKVWGWGSHRVEFPDEYSASKF